jgi:hypothetical protein
VKRKESECKRKPTLQKGKNERTRQPNEKPKEGQALEARKRAREGEEGRRFQ